MKVFLSSVISGFESYRNVAATAGNDLGHEVKRAEDFGAAVESPQVACLSGVRWSDVVITVLGERYGTVQQSNLSATHEEFHEAKHHRDILAFVQLGIEPDERQTKFIEEVQDWARGALTASFRTPDELRSAVTKALHDLDLARVIGPVDENEMLKRARSLTSEKARSSHANITVTIVGGPQREILRPAEIEAPKLARSLGREATYGEAPVLDLEDGVKSRMVGDALFLEQQSASILVDQMGSVRIVQPARRPRERAGDLGSLLLIEEDVIETIARAIRFATWVLELIDPLKRLSHVAVIAAIDGGAMGWKTRDEQARSPNSFSPTFGSGDAIVQLAQPAQRRVALKHDAQKMAEDLTALLRRELKR